MTGGLIALILLNSMCLIQSAELPHLISLTEVELGGNVTLNCSIPDYLENRFIHWYKHSLGRNVLTVASAHYDKIDLTEPSKNQRFLVQKENDKWLLTISSVNKEDEALYFCQSGKQFLQTFNCGFFLAVKDSSQQTSVYVEQTPETAVVRLGDPVTLQCSLLSKNKENTVRCPGEDSVHWFRAGSGKSLPGIVYTHRNSVDGDLRKSCVYRLSRTLHNSTDVGTYFCAVVTCGEILFGSGTKLDERAELDPLVLVLGGLLVCCVTVVIFLLFYIRRRTVCEQCKESKASHCPGQDTPTAGQLTDLESEVHAVNYAAVDFSRRNVKHGKKRSVNSNYLYEAVRADSQSHQQFSL
ncbi:uncharacterized protein LOC121642630 isoform X2 [Melanotaenia boesemani]|uniref:uncharacterized protein LOC121642630 isoform X2 n=1 Tax=Melanotaenia boesemani TaxID=1250792 RepID=UPI001C05E52D|nr:uncharacterized protein LOC121642630 isoform X2 [Melanotaenia boesemani]